MFHCISIRKISSILFHMQSSTNAYNKQSINNNSNRIEYKNSKSFHFVYWSYFFSSSNSMLKHYLLSLHPLQFVFSPFNFVLWCGRWFPWRMEEKNKANGSNGNYNRLLIHCVFGVRCFPLKIFPRKRQSIIKWLLIIEHYYTLALRVFNV